MIVSMLFFILMKIELQAKHIDKNYGLRHHFSFWSEYSDMLKNESNDKKKRNCHITFKGFNISIVTLFI